MTKRPRPRPAVFHILLALARAPLHGLGIARAIDDATNGAFRIGPGTLYRSLNEMSALGLIEEVTSDTEHTHPRTRVYAITSDGREVVRAEALRLEQIVEVARRNRVLPKSS